MVRCGRQATAFTKLPARRLIIRPGGIGDCILSLPAIEFLLADYTEVWVPSAMVPLIRFAPASTIASTGIDLLGLPGVAAPPGLLAKLRSFDSIVSWYGANRPEFRDAVDSLGLPFRFLEALPDPSAKIHAADFFLRQAGGSGVAVPRIAVRAGSFGSFRRDPSVLWQREKELAAGAVSRSGGAAIDAGAMVCGP